MSAFLAVFAFVAFGQQDPTWVAKQWSPKLRPILSVQGLNPQDIITVSSFTTKLQPHPTFVYRYTFKGDYLKVVGEFRKRLAAKAGWKYEELDGKRPLISREIKSGPAEMQAILFQSARLIPDEHGGHPAKGKDGKGWVWISYNERRRPSH